MVCAKKIGVKRMAGAPRVAYMAVEITFEMDPIGLVTPGGTKWSMGENAP